MRVWGLIDGRLHAAVITARGEKIRVISLRRANRREERPMRKNASSRPDETNLEWTAEDFRNARSFLEALPKETADAIRRSRGQRGPQKSPTNELISLRVDQDVLAAYRATGVGWQTRANEALRAYAESGKFGKGGTTAAGRRRATAKRNPAAKKRTRT